MVYKKFLIIVFLLVALFGTKQGVSANIPFGGPILAVYECTCSGGLLVLVYDYMTMLPIPLTYQPFISRLNESFNIFTPTVQTLGTYIPGGVCSMGTFSCTIIPTLGTISPYPFAGVGTGGI